ncbi:MAG TPA: lipase maturation factor family protein [Terriglobia bacterium]|nr:lipase maturation factor family protein [Terriglobia bacterium]
MTGSLPKPLLIYDGDCSFCRFSVDYWRKLTGDRVDYAPFQQAAANFPQIPAEQFRQAVKLIQPDGSASNAAEAVFRVLACAPGYAWLLWLYLRMPGFASASELAYRLVANHRNFFDRLRIIFWGRSAEPPTYFLTRWLFLRLLGFVYLAAFASLSPQILGLVGTHGILPARSFLTAVAQQFGPERYRLFPTLTWLNSSDGFLKFLAGGGAVLSILLIAGVAPGPVLVVLWVFYSSLVTAGQDFLSFQWDSLLLEAGFLAIFFGPWRVLDFPWKNPASTGESPPSRTMVWLFRWLLFRLVFLSGCVKLLSHDPAWRNLTALDYHYETQPLPTPLAWYAFQLPRWFQKCSTASVFVAELFIPFLIFAPRRIRFVACGLLAGFQILIASTGNYAFFNLLTISLCVLLLDDHALRRALPRSLTKRLSPAVMNRKRPPARIAASAVLAAGILLASGSLIWITFFGARSTPHAALELADWVEPLHVVSNYGLFAVMTTSRPEIIIQGSDDGMHWLDYEFRYKPGNLKKPPGWVAPYQPRLDWQMWFAALSTYRGNPWFVNLMIRLLQGSPQVLGLFAKNPFPDSPPRYVRAMVYDYRFTNFAERRATGDWWQRKLEGSYFPMASLRQP